MFQIKMKIKSSTRMGRVMFLTETPLPLPRVVLGGGPQIDYQNAGEKTFVAIPVTGWRGFLSVSPVLFLLIRGWDGYLYIL